MQGNFAFGNTTNDTWKVLVYMQADNDLSAYAFWDLAEMETSVSTTVPVLVELDLPGNSGIKRLEIRPQPETIEFEKVDFSKWSLTNLKSKIIKEFPESKFIQEERLLNFLIESEEKYPTDHTLVVIWGHGEGFSASSMAQFGGVAIDEFPKKSKLSITSIEESIKIYHSIFNKKIDILSMDACLMQTFEVAIQFKDDVDYIIGSNQIQDFRGLNYDSILAYMNRKQIDLSPYTLAQSIPRLFEKRASLQTKRDKRTISAINLSELDTYLVPTLDKTSELISKYLDTDFFNRLELIEYISKLPFFLGESRDISSFFSHLDEYFLKKNEYDISLSIKETLTSIDRASVAYYYGDSYLEDKRYHLGAFKAFGLWVPGSIEEYDKRIYLFSESELYKLVPNWSQLLNSLFSKSLF